MTEIKIVPCRLEELRLIWRRLRHEEIIELRAAKLHVRHAMFQLWYQSIQPRAAMIDGQVAAVWGDAAPPLAAEGQAWLFTSDLIERAPIGFTKAVKKEIARMLVGRQQLRSSVHRSCERAIRFYQMLGFEVRPSQHDQFVDIIRVSQ